MPPRAAPRLRAREINCEDPLCDEPRGLGLHPNTHKEFTASHSFSFSWGIRRRRGVLRRRRLRSLRRDTNAIRVVLEIDRTFRRVGYVAKKLDWRYANDAALPRVHVVGLGPHREATPDKPRRLPYVWLAVEADPAPAPTATPAPAP